MESDEPEITEMHDDDPCCAARLGKALRAGSIHGNRWTCPKCGCAWQARMLPELSTRHWSPDPMIEVLRMN